MIKLLFSLLYLTSHIVSWRTTCMSSSCRNSYNYCYSPSCGFLNYCLNPDYFTFYFKDSMNDFKLKKSEFKQELNQLAADNQEDMAALSADLSELKNNLKDNLNRMTSEVSSLASELRNQRAELLAERDAAWSELRNSWKSSRNVYKEWREAHMDLNSDVNALSEVLSNNRKENIRALVLSPANTCGDSCVNNYTLLYSAWKVVVVKLRRVLVTRLSASPCSVRRSQMRTYFDEYCAPYPRKVVLKLRSYYNYLVAPNVCSW